MADFASFHDVISRLGDVKEAGRFLRFRCLFPERHAHGDRTPSAYLALGHDGTLLAGCYGCGAKTPEFVQAVGLPWTAWIPPELHRKRREPIVDRVIATYQYRDRDGVLLHEKLRHEPKRFAQRRPLPAEWRKRLGVPGVEPAWVWGLNAGEYGRNGRDGWHFRTPCGPDTERITLPEVRRVLYRLPELVKADPRQPVFVVEGEKDADALSTLGFIATCSPFGTSAWLAEFSAELHDRRVVVVPDHDEPGYQMADLTAGSLMRAGCPEVRYYEWPAASDAGWDVSAFLEQLPEQDRRPSAIELAKIATVYKKA